MSDQQANTQPPALWAVVELLGHNRIAGRVSEQVFAGAALIRIDVPEIVVSEMDYDESPPVRRQRLIQAHTRSFGPGSIYAVNWCDEEVATAAARAIKHEPLRPYGAKEQLAELIAESRQLRLASDIGPDDDPEDLDGHGRTY